MNVRFLGIAGGAWVVVAACAAGGCSAEPSSTPLGTGGQARAGGGTPTAGGSSSASGTLGSGGVVGSGGSPLVAGASGAGASSVGGATLTGGTSSSSGGASSNGMGGSVPAAGVGTTAGGSGGTAVASGGTATAGATASAGANVTGGVAAMGGGSAAGGAKSTGGAPGTGGSTSVGGTISTGGAKSTGGNPSTGGTTTTGGTTSGACGTVVSNPFTSCKFAWGAPSSGSNSSYLSFVSTWIGDETNGGLASLSATATNNSCGDCSLVQSIAATSSMVVFYTYFIGFQACKLGNFCDCNTDGDGHTLCTDGAQWIRSNRAALINMYAQYAKRIYAVSPNKPTIWWLEGDFIQYSYATQTSPLSYAELGALARDITCAIKSNQPNAVVAMNHSPWIADKEATDFWSAQPLDVLDLVWVQGAGDTDVFLNSAAYNAATAKFAWLHQKTGKKIMAETSYAGSGQSDRWTSTTAANIDARISNGVIGVHVNAPPSNYQAVVGSLSLSSTCN